MADRRGALTARTQKRRWPSWMLPALGGAMVFAVVVVVMTAIAFLHENRSSVVAGDAGIDDGVQVHAEVVQVLPEQDHLVVRLAFEPIGKFAQDRSFLAQPVRVVGVGGLAVMDMEFEAGEVMPPENLSVALGDGEVGDFPFDGYHGVFQVRIVDDAGAAVPSVLRGEASVHGYRMTMSDPIAEPNGGNDLAIDVGRAPMTKMFGIFTIVLMWCLTILVLILAVGEIVRDGPVDAAVVSLFGVLLFAFPAVRNAVPNAPPIGVLSDFIAFFWCEIALGIGLMVLLVTHIGRQRRYPMVST